MIVNKSFYLSAFQVAFLVLFLLSNVHAKSLAARGLAANVSTQCTSGCSWSTASIWIDGIIPVPTDTVDIQASGTYTIIVDSSVTVADFDIGFTDSSHGSQTFIVTNGATFTSTGQANSALSVTIQVDSGASMLISGQSTVQGTFKLSGLASFGGTTSPSLYIDTQTIQTTLSPVKGKLELNSGVLVVTNKLEISSSSTLTGNGVINGSVIASGNINPGLSGVGNFKVYGDFTMGTLTVLTLDVASLTSFDHIFISQTFYLNGFVVVSAQGDYEPLSHSEYIVVNHSAARDGFKSVTGTGFISSIFNDKWTAAPGQTYTSIFYDSASSVLISFFLLGACLLFTIIL